MWRVCVSLFVCTDEERNLDSTGESNMEQTTKSKSSDETDEDKDVFAASGTRPTTRSHSS
jgi:hypothetical protein